MKSAPWSSPEEAVSHLDPEVWSQVNKHLVCKMIAEFAHEILFEPELLCREDGWGCYTLAVTDSDVEYRFRAKVYSLEHWHIDERSLEKRAGRQRLPVDAMRFIVEFNDRLGIDNSLLATYLEEVSSTLYGAAYKHVNQRFSAEELARAGFQEVEAGMTEGHPCFVANNGRIGFDARDYRAFAPEVGTPVKLLWLAAHESRATFASIDEIGYRDLLQHELSEETLAGFERCLRREGLDPDTYVYMPVHPWQWTNKLANAFAPEIAARKLVCLGPGDDDYQAQQSIRTFFNLSSPHKHYVKTSLSILNMGFMRGLSAYYMETTPAINAWVHGLIEDDDYLRASGFRILRELATVGYRNPYYEEVEGLSPYKKMLAALWRESPIPELGPGQRLMTMASLLHRDRDGDALLPALIRSSGLDTDTWLRRYLKSYLSPLLHFFYAYDMVFMPHGENLILVLEDNAPVKVFMKDIGEEVGVMNKTTELPEKAQRIAIEVPDEIKPLSIFTDIFDCFFRFLSSILSEDGGQPEQRFWELVAECIHEYQRQHPDMAAKFERCDLFVPEFTRSCINRLQLANHQQLFDFSNPEPASELQFAGTLKNPVAPFRAGSPERRGEAG